MTQNIKIMLLGGVRENGKNMYAVQVDDKIFILDAGLKYPENELLGIDVVIPDLQFFEENHDQIAGIFLTHGHEDAIGALPYILADYNIPVFGSELTIALAKIAVENGKNKKKIHGDFHVIDADTEIDFGDVNVSFFQTTHTIPGSLGIVVKTSEGNIVYTGDYKFDQTASSEYQTDFGRVGEIGKQGVLALLGDSTGAETYTQNASEVDIEEYVLDAFTYQDGRIIVASVASNIRRIQQVLNAAAATGRKVLLTGRDLAKIVRTALKLNYLSLPEPDLLIQNKDLEKLPKEETVILETGRTGEPLSSLQKMATNNHRLVSIEPGDLVFITTTPSTAMETTVAKTSDLIYRAGGEVKEIRHDLKSSGHGTRRDMQLMINLLKPKFLIPVQGEYRLLANHSELAIEAGMPAENIFITKKGDSLIYENDGFFLTDPVPADDVMIDGSGIGDIGNIVLRDRKVLSDDGIFITAVTIDRKKKKIIAQPKVTTRGFVYIKANRKLMNDAQEVVKDAILENLDNKKFDWNELKQDIRSSLEKFLFDQTHRKPVILPVVMEVNQNRHRAMNKGKQSQESDDGER